MFAAFVLGWGIAAALHLAFGSPAGRPTVAQVAGALDELGVTATNVRLAPDQTRGYTVMLADGVDGAPLHLRVYGRDAADTQLVGKIWRFFLYKDSGATLTFTRLQQVEHEALCQIVAQQAGVPVPDVVAAGVAGPSAALLVTTRPVGGRGRRRGRPGCASCARCGTTSQPCASNASRTARSISSTSW